LFSVLDPVNSFKLSSKQRLAIQNLFNPKYNFVRSDNWEITYPKASLSIGDKALQCGPFLCYYAEACVNGWNLEKFPDVETYRIHVLSTLIGGCSPFSGSKSTKKCFYCKLGTKTEGCDFCGRPAHVNCLQQFTIRGRTYNVCCQNQDTV